MQIAVCSDIHDNIWRLESALKDMAEASALVCCGDLCAPFTLVQLAEGFAGPIHVAWGNNDGDKWLLARQAARFDHVELHGDMIEIRLGDVDLAVSHYPQIARAFALSGRYDLVCCGHDHTAHVERMERTVLLNPGEIMGRLGRSTWAMFDTQAGTATIRDIS